MLIKGDNIIVLEKLNKKYANSIDLVYVDIPYNTGNVFNTCSTGGKTISKVSGEIAYNDDMPFTEYLSFIKRTLELAQPLLSDKWSFYLHIDCKVGHYIKIIMDEVLGMENFRNDITRIKSNPKNFSRKAWGNQKDMILFYSAKNAIWNDIRVTRTNDKNYKKKDERGFYTTVPCHAPGITVNGETGTKWRGLLPPAGRHWRVSPKELDRLDAEGRIEWSRNGNPRIKNYLSDMRGKKYQDIWTFKDPQKPVYPTEKNADMLDLIVRQSSSENSIVMDYFCGSGVTLLAAKKNGRRYIGIDSSEEAIKTCEKRLNVSRNTID